MEMVPGDNFSAKKFSPGPPFQRLPTYQRLPLVAALLTGAACAQRERTELDDGTLIIRCAPPGLGGSCRWEILKSVANGLLWRFSFK